MTSDQCPFVGRYYMCHSRNALLKCVEHPRAHVWIFERVLSMSQWESNQKPEGFREELPRNMLGSIFEINAMEALAYASR